MVSNKAERKTNRMHKNFTQGAVHSVIKYHDFTLFKQTLNCRQLFMALCGYKAKCVHYYYWSVQEKPKRNQTTNETSQKNIFILLNLKCMRKRMNFSIKIDFGSIRTNSFFRQKDWLFQIFDLPYCSILLTLFHLFLSSCIVRNSIFFCSFNFELSFSSQSLIKFNLLTTNKK